MKKSNKCAHSEKRGVGAPTGLVPDALLPDVLLQVASDLENQERCRLTEPIHRAYCEKWGFQHVIAAPPYAGHAQANWDKLKILRSLLAEREGRYVVMIDADALVARDDIDLRSALPSHAFLGVNIHPYVWPSVGDGQRTFHYNCGVLYFRSSPACIEFLDYWLSHESDAARAGKSEQCVLNDILLGEREWQAGVATLDQRWNANVHNQPHEDAAVVAWHGAGCRLARMQDYIALRGLAAGDVPVDPSQVFLLAYEMHQNRRYLDAERQYRRFLALPGVRGTRTYIDALLALADLQTMLNHPRDAVRLAREVIALEPDHGQAHLVLGLAYEEEDDPRAGWPYEQAAMWRPQWPDAYWSLGLWQLRTGNWVQGWQNYQRRFFKHEKPRMQTPEWSPESSVPKALLISTWQGAGDTFQFLRFLPWLRERLPNTRLYLEVAESQAPLLIGQPDLPVDAVVKTDLDGCLPDREIDAWVSLFSLPFVIGLQSPADLERFPKKYLRAENPVTLPGHRLKVGIRWHGTQLIARNHIRSIDPKLLSCLADIDGVDWYGLQYGEPTDALPLAGMVEQGWSWKETADFFAGLDLVVSTCTSAIHLAGAMGIPSVLMLARPADWRWGTPANPIYWYDDMIYARQQVTGDWRPVLAAVRERLSRQP